MKNQFTPFFLTIIAMFILLSCSNENDDREVYEEQNFLSGFLQTSGFNHTELSFIGYPIHFGYSFTPLVEGKINSIVIKVPLEYEENIITLWDKSTGEPIASKTVSLPAEYEVTVDVEPIQLIKDKEYIISITSMASYARSNNTFDNAEFPIVEGDIQINYCSMGGNSETMPNSVIYNYYFGDLSFNFQRTQ